MFYIGAVALAFFLALLLLTKKNKSTADQILSAWLFLISTHLLFFYFLETNLYPQTLGLSLPYPLLHGPFLFLYTLAITNRLRSLPLSLLHFIPFLVAFLYVIPFVLLPVEQKIYVFEHQGEGYEGFNLLMSIAIPCSGLFYISASAWELQKHRVAIANQFSDIEKISLRWLQYLIYWMGLIWIMVLFANDIWVYGTAVLFILFIGVFGIRQTHIFYTPDISSPANTKFASREATAGDHSEDEPGPAEPEKRKYLKSGLGQEDALVLHARLSQLMADQKVYTRKELSLAELADVLDTHANHLSQVINEQEGKNFYDYINTLRIEEFKRMAASADNRKYTLLALAEHCGFSSKSSFNRYFKKVTGQSPSTYVQAAPVAEK